MTNLRLVPNEDGWCCMRAWSVREVLAEGKQMPTRHLVGFEIHSHEGRVTSAITAFDAAARTVTTTSGRCYFLDGEPGFDPDGDYVWQFFLRSGRVTVHADKTEEYI